MADKINKEECVARVYQFLNKHKDWKTKANENNDETIAKTEFRAYLYSSDFKFNSGENKSDIVDAFWDSIDVNTFGKVTKGSLINNKNALDNKEVNNIEETIKATETIIKFMQDKEAPSEIGEYATKWKNSVKQGLIYRASEYIKTGGKVTEEWLNEAYKISSVKATADYMATTLINEKLGNINNYKVASDDNLKLIIDEYVAELENNQKSEAEVIADIRKLIDAYIDTAITNSKESIKLLGNYGYDSSEINDLQHAVLINDVQTAVTNRINPDIIKFMSNEVNEKIKEFVDSFIDNGDDFMKMKNNVQNYASQFISSPEFLAIENEYNEFKKSKDKLVEFVENQASITDYSTERQGAMNEIFKTNDVDKIKQMINDYDKKTLEAQKTAFEKLINNVELSIVNKALEKINSVTPCFEGTELGEVKFDGSISTLTIKSSNSECPITISPNGIKINTTNPGSWATTIEIYNESGELLSSKSVTITIDKKLDLTKAEGTFEDHTFAEIMTRSDIGVLLCDLEATIENAASLSKSKISSIINNLKATLIAAGYSAAKLEAAAFNLISYYSAAIDAAVEARNFYNTSNMGEMRNIRFMYVDSKGNTVSETGNFQNNVDSDSEPNNYINKNLNSLGIALNYSYQSNDKIQFTINSRVLLSKLMSFYNAQ